MVTKILSTLSNLDSSKIFDEANKGIESSTRTIKRLGLTQKRYYTRLSELIEAGLVQKNGEGYSLTLLGKLTHKMGETFFETLGKYDRIDLLDRLKRSKTLTSDEVEEISKMLARDVVDTFNLADMLSYVRVVDTWDKLVENTIEYLEKAEESIYIASRHSEKRIIETVITKTLEEDIETYFLYDKQYNSESVTKSIRRITSMITSPGMPKNVFTFLNSDYIRNNLRFTQLPYTFLVVDGQYAMVEITKPSTTTFVVAFFFKDVNISKKLIETFNGLWKKAEGMKDMLSRIPLV